jgi:replicative DNA helicase Mcm
MSKRFLDIVKSVLPLRAEYRDALTQAARYLDDADVRALRRLVKLDRTFPVQEGFAAATLQFERHWPRFKSHLKEKEVDEFLKRINDKIEREASAEAFAEFGPEALEKIGTLIAPNILGQDLLKRTAALQLFSKEPFHVLFIGDPGTGKTDILRSLHTLSPIGSFGLGSGTSGAGLSVMAKGDEIIKGLLPQADGGIACIDELNLMKAKDMAALYNAMEKGFVTYDKGSKHEQLPARVRVCATANPLGDTFVGQSAEVIRKQIPFDDALLSRFHFVHIVRKPTADEFAHIASHIVKHDGRRTIAESDASFVKAYVQHAWTLETELPVDVERRIVDFVREIKRDEKRFIVEIGPRSVVGIVRIARAVARAHNSKRVTPEHLDIVFALLRDALYVRKEIGDDAHG